MQAQCKKPDLSIPCCYCRSPKRVRPQIYISFFQKTRHRLMKQAALLLAGKHDFKKFSTVKKNKSTEKEILNIDIYEDLEEIQITLEATDFLHNMPRMILSTCSISDLASAARKKLTRFSLLLPLLWQAHLCDPKGSICRKLSTIVKTTWKSILYSDFCAPIS